MIGTSSITSLVKMDDSERTLTLGEKFTSFEEIEIAIKEHEDSKYIQMYRRHSRTIDSFKQRYPKKSHLDIPSDAELVFACIHGGKAYKSEAKELSESGRPKER